MKHANSSPSSDNTPRLRVGLKDVSQPGFADGESVFNGPTSTLEDRRDYQGEQRFNTTGLLGVQVVVITHTETDDEIHFISMREAENHETRQFFSQL